MDRKDFLEEYFRIKDIARTLAIQQSFVKEYYPGSQMSLSVEGAIFIEYYDYRINEVVIPWADIDNPEEAENRIEEAIKIKKEAQDKEREIRERSQYEKLYQKYGKGGYK